LRRARVAVEHRSAFIVYFGEGQEGLATLAGKLRYDAQSREDLPAVGDWVLVRESLIEVVLPRRSAFVRRAAGAVTEAQVIAANIDTVFIVCGLDGDYNLRRIERYAAATHASGARGVALLNKADMVDAADARLAEVKRNVPGIEVYAVSALNGTGTGALAEYLEAGQTVALVGSSGAGKSTLVNRLLGRPKQITHPVREDDSRGRHTTTHRELIPMESGAFLIDTPGLRELQLWMGEDQVSSAFEDIEALAARCRFRDCAHAGEDGCAVQIALESGELDAGRFENFRKLAREAAYHERQVDLRAALELKAEWKRIHKRMRREKQG
jgi:ribosome biogenesis GTPase